MIVLKGIPYMLKFHSLGKIRLSITKIEIYNKFDNTGTTYSKYGYDISGATRQNTIYPSMDPCIFEVRYPDTDIQGRVVPFTI